MFLSFANFYPRFIQRYSKIVALFISMLKTTSSNANIKTIMKATENSIFLTPDVKLAFS